MTGAARLFLPVATAVAACNGLVGNESVSVWNPDAEATEATTGPSGDGGESPASPDASAAPGDGSSDTSADAAVPPPVGIAFEIVSAYSGTCVDVGSTKQAGSPLSLTVCRNLAQQLLVLRSAGASYSIFNPNSGKCVAAHEQDGGVPNGAGLELQACSDASAQVFDVQGSAGSYVFVSSAGGACLDDAAFGASSGARVEIYACNAGVNQRWGLVQ